MRGRGSSGGSKDSGGREIQDIIDCLRDAMATYPDQVNPDQVYIVGYSGGGGNVLGALCRFPDTFAGGIDHFGMSSYSAWYAENAAYRSKMETQIGGTPAEVPDAYASREYRDAVINYVSGHLWLIHDPDDNIVEVSHSTSLISALDNASLENYSYHPDDWGHASPIPDAENIWVPSIQAGTYSAWTVAESGVLQVAGWVDTKRFSLWLGSGNAEFGELTYDMTTREFTITTDTGASAWTLTLFGQTPSSSIAATINAVGESETSDADGVVTFTGSIE